MLVLPPGYSKQNITFVQAPALGKSNLLADESNNHVIYRIASNRCSAVKWKGYHYSLSFPKSYALFYNVFSDVIFYPRVLQYFRVSKTLPALVIVALLIWHSSYRA